MWRAAILGCLFIVGTATAGERSPGNDLQHNGGPRDRREAWKRWHQQRFAQPSPFFYRPGFYRRGFPSPQYVYPWQPSCGSQQGCGRVVVVPVVPNDPYFSNQPYVLRR